MKILKLAVAAILVTSGLSQGLGAASATVLSNPINGYSFASLAGAPLVGGQQTQFIGETFNAPIDGAITDFQFTLNSSTINSLYAAVYKWDGFKPIELLWQSSVVSGVGKGANGGGLLDFSPVGVNLVQGQTYVAFLSTYGIANNTGVATVGSCLSFSQCTSVDANLGNLVYSTIYSDTNPLPGSQSQSDWSNAFKAYDATFSVTVSAVGAVPEPSTWAMMILGFAGLGTIAYRRQSKSSAHAA